MINITMCFDYETAEKQNVKNKNLKKEYIEVEPKLEKIRRTTYGDISKLVVIE